MFEKYYLFIPNLLSAYVRPHLIQPVVIFSKQEVKYSLSNLFYSVRSYRILLQLKIVSSNIPLLLRAAKLTQKVIIPEEVPVMKRFNQCV